MGAGRATYYSDRLANREVRVARARDAVPGLDCNSWPGLLRCVLRFFGVDDDVPYPADVDVGRDYYYC